MVQTVSRALPVSARVARRRPAARLSRRLLVAGTVLALLTPLGPSATADNGHQVFPSQHQVDASRGAVANTADRVGQIEAQLAAASVRTDRLATGAAQAVEAYNGARVRLDRAVQAALEAQQAAKAARERVATSRTALGRFAAAAYRSGGDLGGLSTFLVAQGPRDLISRAAALQSIGNSRRNALEGLRSAQAYAAVLDHRAAATVAKRRAATEQVAAAKSAAESRLASQQQAVGQIAAQRETLVRALASARHTTVRLERARQAGLELARAAAARRAAERKAAAAARAAEAARQAAAAQAAEDARRAAAEQTRRAAEQQAADQRAADQRAADQKAADQKAAEAASNAPSSPAPSNAGSGNAGGGGNGGGGNGGGGNGGGGNGSAGPSTGGSGASTGGTGGGSGAGPPPAPAPSSGSSSGTASGAEAAIAFARAQIGKPYEWAADGPSTFDCSGLTMRAWQQGGVGLSHYSVAQYEEGQKVALTDLRRGDLVFFASNGDYHSIFHVGLYIGDGQMIEAPYTGESVRISSIWRSSLFGAARP